MNKPLMENPTMRKSLRSTCRCVGVSMTLAVLMLACRAERLQVEPFMDEPRPVELINGPVGKALTSVRDSSLFGEGSILSESDVVGLGGPSCALGSVACGFSAINNELYWEGEGGTYFLSTGVGSVWARGVFEIFRGTATTSTGKVISCGYPVMKANVCSESVPRLVEIRVVPGDHRLRGDGGRGEFGVQRFLQQGEMLHPAHATKLEFDLQQRRRHPSLLLITGAPVRDATGVPFETRHHALDQVGGMETLSQLVGDPQAMQRQRFVETFLQAARG